MEPSHQRGCIRWDAALPRDLQTRLHSPSQPPSPPPARLHTAPPSPKSTRRVTLEVQADQRYTQVPSPTASVFCALQSTRFR